MRKFLNSAVISASLLFSTSPVSAADFFSHVDLNLPYEHRTDEQWVRIITSPEEWAAFYEELRPELADFVPGFYVAPEIDFDQFMIVAGGLGFRSAGSHQLAVDRIIDTGDTVYVNAIAVRPGAGCVVGQAVSYPTVAIMMRKTDKNIMVNLSEGVSNCDSITAGE